MGVIFPSFPIKNQIFDYRGDTWVYNGNWWVKSEPNINWVINDGGGEGIYEYKRGTTIALKTLIVGSGLTISSTTNEIIVSYSG